jgi:hypothetical protein
MYNKKQFAAITGRVFCVEPSNAYFKMRGAGISPRDLGFEEPVGLQMGARQKF